MFTLKNAWENLDHEILVDNLKNGRSKKSKKTLERG